MGKSKRKRDQQHRRGRRGIRPFWSGTLVFGLVSVPVEIYPGQTSARIAMRMLAPDGTPLVRRYHCPEHQVDVHPEHLVRGFQLEDDRYVVIRDEELEAAAPEKSREIDLRQFAKIEQVPQRLFERSYFLTPAGDSNKAYRLLAEAMEHSGLAGIATFVMRGKEYLVAILSEGGILRAQTLRFSDQIRSPQDVGLSQGMADDAALADQFLESIEKLSQPTLSGIDLGDEDQARLERLVNQKYHAGQDVVRTGDATAREQEDRDAGDADGETVDLLEVIRRSLGEPGRHSPSAAEASHRSGNGSAANLSDLSKQQLYERAQQLQIRGRSEMNKADLVKAIQQHQR